MDVAHEDPLAALDAYDALATQPALAGPGRRQGARFSLAPPVPKHPTDALHGNNPRPRPMDRHDYMQNVYISISYGRICEPAAGYVHRF
jgi:hypothetical protein